MSTVTLAQPPIFIQEGEYSARLTRNITSLLGTEGVIGANDFLVSERAASPAMQVDIAVGRALIDGDDIANQQNYFVVSETVVELAVPAADPVDPRVDLVVLRVLDSDAGVVGDEAQVELIEGTPGLGVPLPAVPPTAIPLAYVTVSPAVIAILDANISDQRPFSAPTVNFDLDGIRDVDAPSPSNGDVLTYEGGDWTAQSPVGLIIALGG